MAPAWFEASALAWIVLSLLSALLIGAHVLLVQRQKMAVMNAVWPLTGLWAGPIALLAYLAHLRAAERPFWAKVALGDTHCGAGCTLGDFAGEWIVFLGGLSVAGSSLMADYAVDFALAFAVGIVFQYFAIAPMRGISGWPGVKAALKADTVSLLAFEVGMFGWMGLSRFVLFDPPLEPMQLTYWFNMQIAMFVGFATAFPANWWLMRSGLKEAM